MKYKFIIFICALTFPFMGNAQLSSGENRTLDSYYFLAGEKQVNFDVGLINAQNFAFSLFGSSGGGDPSPSFNLSFDYALTNNIALGAYTSYYRVDASSSIPLDNLDIDNLDINDLLTGIGCLLGGDCNTEIQERISVYTMGGKLMLHQPVLEKISTYASTYLGYSFNKRKTITEEGLDAVSNELGLDTEVPSLVYYASAGARLYVTNKLGIYGEYGYGNVHLLKIGLSYKL
jgi:hypothetical protein